MPISKELVLRRKRHYISARKMAIELGVSYGWLRQIEKYYSGPSIPDWERRYEGVLLKLVSEKAGKGGAK
ncbi:MAG: hypothetical protein KKB90_02140 [Actinobacteria bacterium]|nr:hypothetical protein [Actinomycetota bacterium]MCG2817860.1 hypothetical protein [Actinomycetes bacterium]MBU4217746.1 hypothetical protein [Actinomycetota bacterium]MBU4358941.1 hypothetical protein [Actinomycetota bacterium]MBU4391718.1 hypothetical protein [Actinomycetota bacterium]